MIFRIVIVLILLVVPQLTMADTSTFVIGVQGGEDTIPPTEPVILNATPTAATQIDIAWSTSIDDVYLGGYVLLRDSFAIATTTLTSYSDTGLSASTTYSYSVYAFDGFGNVSTTSLAVATTTLPLPIVVAPTSTDPVRQESTLVFLLRNFSLVTTETVAKLEWQTSRPGKYILKWGRTESYDSGYISSELYDLSHRTSITDLEPGTTYSYELVGYDARGYALVLRKGTFTTKDAASLVPPNVLNLRASLLSDGMVGIRFVRPPLYEQARVRIVRSYLGYPRDPFDGAVIYEGNKQEFLDKTAFIQGNKEYYAVFLFGEDGTYSSGAVASVNKYKEPTLNPVVETGEILPVEVEELVPTDFTFDRKFIEIIQDDLLATFASGTVRLDLSKNTIIKIPYNSLPDNLKSIVVTITDPTDFNRTYSFLLRINKDRSAYEAVLAPLGVAGHSRIVVEIFDFERSVVGRYQKAVEFTQSAVLPEVIFPDKIVKSLYPNLVPLFGTLGLFLVSLFFWWKRRQGDKH